MYHCHKEYFSWTEKNILQHQWFIESYAELLEPIPIPSLVMTFAVIHSLIFDEAAKLFHKLGKVVALITVHSWSPSMNVHDLVYWAWKQVVFLANIFYTGAEAASNSKPNHWWGDPDSFQELCVTLNKFLVLKNNFFCNRMSQQQNLHCLVFCEIFYHNFAYILSSLVQLLNAQAGFES